MIKLALIDTLFDSNFDWQWVSEYTEYSKNSIDVLQLADCHNWIHWVVNYTDALIVILRLSLKQNMEWYFIDLPIEYWLIEILFELLIDWLIDRLIDLIDWFILIDCLIHWRSNILTTQKSILIIWFTLLLYLHTIE